MNAATVRSLLLFAAPLITGSSPPAQQVLVDINQQPDSNPSSLPSQFLSLGSTAYFSAERKDVGAELWVTDGTTVQLVADIHPGPAGSYPKDLLDLGNGQVLFNAFHPSFGREPWVLDVASGSAQLLKDVLPGLGSSVPSPLILHSEATFNGRAYFSVSDGVHGVEPWQTDGTPAGTTLLADVAPGIQSSFASGFTASGTDLFFTAVESDFGTRHLWRTDGTSNDVEKLGGAPASELVDLAGTLYFASDGAGGRELWSSDGTVAGTALAVDLNSSGSSAPRNLTVAGGSLRFVADIDNFGPSLVQSDGTVAGTSPLASFPSTDSYIHSVTTLGSGTLFIEALPNGANLWFADGTPGGTNLVGPAGAHARGFAVAGGIAYYSSTLSPTGLSATDGVSTSPVPGAADGVTSVEANGAAAVGGELFFAGYVSVPGPIVPGQHVELWKTDTASGSMQWFADLNPGALSGDAWPTETTAFGDRVVFSADDGIHGREPWISDGTAAGSYILGDLLAGPEGSLPRAFHSYGDRVLIGTSGGAWISDGTAAGTTNLAQFGAAVSAIQTLGNRALLTVGAGGLWVTDGSPAGTTELHGFHSSPGLVIDGTYYWPGSFPGAGHEILATDGESVWIAASLLTGPEPEEYFNAPDKLTAVGTDLYFVGLNPLGQRVLHRLETATGLLTIVDQATGGHQQVLSMAAFDGELFFGTPKDISVGYELHRTDGVDVNLVLDIKPGSGSGLMNSPMRKVGDRLLFAAKDADNPPRVWSTDGTAAGTTPISSILPVSGPLQTIPTGTLAALGNSDFALLSGSDAPANTLGPEVWVTDGTDGGTHLLADLLPGSIGSDPQTYVRAGDRVFFTAYSEFGRELWSTPFTETGGSAWDTVGLGCPDASGRFAEIALDGAPSGGALVTATLDSATPNAGAVLLAAVDPVALNLGGCSLEVGAGFLLAGTEITDAAGSALNPLTFPAGPSLVGVPIVLQWFVLDPGGDFLGAGGTTPGLELITSH